MNAASGLLQNTEVEQVSMLQSCGIHARPLQSLIEAYTSGDLHLPSVKDGHLDDVPCGDAKRFSEHRLRRQSPAQVPM